jgi:hypothetical protein
MVKISISQRLLVARFVCSLQVDTVAACSLRLLLIERKWVWLVCLHTPVLCVCANWRPFLSWGVNPESILWALDRLARRIQNETPPRANSNDVITPTCARGSCLWGDGCYEIHIRCARVASLLIAFWNGWSDWNTVFHYNTFRVSRPHRFLND